MQLAIIFGPEKGESSLGYYRRLAASNALWHWKELAKMAEVSPSRSGLLGHPHYMASTLGLELSWAVAAAQQEQAARGKGLAQSSSQSTRCRMPQVSRGISLFARPLGAWLRCGLPQARCSAH